MLDPNFVKGAPSCLDFTRKGLSYPIVCNEAS